MGFKRTLQREAKGPCYAEVKTPGSFEQEQHFYERVLNAHTSSVVTAFLHMANQQIVTRYIHLNPTVKSEKLLELLEYEPKFFKWVGADLFNVTTESGIRKMVLIEANSCPSGQKSMPAPPNDEYGGYKTLIEHTFFPTVKQHEANLPKGGLAVIYDKNKMEASGYAATMAEVFQETVYLVEFYHNDLDPSCKWVEKVLHVRTPDLEWHPIRAAFRYVTQKPWNRIPLINSRTLIINPIAACLAGGRNKLVAAKAYEFLNAEISASGLKIETPLTIRDVHKSEIPLWVKSMGGFAVIKNPYSNAGQGVWTITSSKELSEFMLIKQDYGQFIVQSLVGNYKWSSSSAAGQFFHVGTVPDKNNDIYVADLRMMVHFNGTKKSFRPLALYGRRARKPLLEEIPEGTKSWDILGTNLSVKEDDAWGTETSRLLLMDAKDFNRLGMGLDDLIMAYIQTVMSAVAIDKLACRVLKGGDFNFDLFSSLDKDDALLKEILL